MLRKLTYRIAAATAWLGLALAPAGCSKSDAPAPDEGREVTLSFRIATQLPPTRAEIVATEEGLADENWVDVDDARFLLFTQGGALLQELRPTLDQEAADYATYTVKATIREPYFDYAVDNGSVRFRIMVLANWPQEALNAIAGCTTESEIEAKAATWTMPSAAWMPEAGTRGIPMYGLKEFTVTTDALRQSDENSPADLTSEINLLRALAKLEVIDNIQTKNDAGYPRIQSVTLLQGSYYTLARLIPDGFRDGVQVTAPTLPAAHVPATADRALAERNYTTGQTPAGGTARDYTFKGWTTYLPEMQFNTNDALQVVVENDPAYVGKTGTDGAKIPATYTVTIPMPDADGVWDGQFLRNHIYRLEVVSAGSNMTMQYTYTICPWIERSTDITFE